jgi:hypothetical protein
VLWRRSSSTEDWKAESVSRAWYQVLGMAVSMTERMSLGIVSVSIGRSMLSSKSSGVMVASEAGTARAAVAKSRVARTLCCMVTDFLY